MDTSLDDENNTKVVVMEEKAPKWASDLVGKVEIVLEKFNLLVEKVDEVELKTSENRAHIQHLEGNLSALQGEHEELKGKFDSLQTAFDSQVDRSLRDHVNFYGLKPLSPEKTYEDTTARLSQWLAEKLGKNPQYFNAAIERCHRGPFNPDKTGPRPIYCKMRWRVAEEVREKLTNKETDGVRIRDMYSKGTQSRVNKALMYRKEWRSRNPGDKVFVAYPAKIMIKKQSGESYNLERVF